MEKRTRPSAFDGRSLMITRRSADLPVALYASIQPVRAVAPASTHASIATGAASAEAWAEPVDLRLVCAAPMSDTVDSTRSRRLRATWIRTGNGTLICRWTPDDETSGV
jgi:hypothetical protein